jgi:hypothetical protein
MDLSKLVADAERNLGEAEREIKGFSESNKIKNLGGIKNRVTELNRKVRKVKVEILELLLDGARSLGITEISFSFTSSFYSRKLVIQKNNQPVFYLEDPISNTPHAECGVKSAEDVVLVSEKHPFIKGEYYDSRSTDAFTELVSKLEKPIEDEVKKSGALSAELRQVLRNFEEFTRRVRQTGP